MGASPFPPAARAVEEARVAAELGFDATWWPDHLMGWFPNALWPPDHPTIPHPHSMLDPVALVAAASAQARLPLGISVTDPFRRPPALLAQLGVTLNELTDGKFRLGLGVGVSENLHPFGLGSSRPTVELGEALEILHLLWSSSRPVDYRGRRWRLNRARTLTPLAHGRPELWLAAHGPRTIELAARFADGWLPARSTLEAYRQGLWLLRERLQTHGRGPASVTPGLFAWLVLGADHDECHELLASPLLRAIGLFRRNAAFEAHGTSHPLQHLVPSGWGYVPTFLERRSEAERAADAVPWEIVHDYILHGTVAEVVSELARYAEAGCRHAVLFELSRIIFPDDAHLRQEQLGALAGALR
jgi:phthiodiolone/phenolphthiodiolone dimycocerosates ketoreductase